MILQLHGYPLHINGVPASASEPFHYKPVFKILRWVMLNESDWAMIPDSPLTDSEREEWKQWRQYLRDLPNSMPETLGETFEINDPPTNHCPQTWINLTPAADWAENHSH